MTCSRRVDRTTSVAPSSLSKALSWPAAPAEGERLADGVFLLRGFAYAAAGELVEAVRAVSAVSPFRHMITPGGYRMSVAITGCGALGWVSDAKGYRYESVDPETGRAWPALPAVFDQVSRSASAAVGFHGFAPDACMINRYQTGSKMSLHRDKDERDFSQPIVSVSLGVSARFQLGGLVRSGAVERVVLEHGDVLVWGGRARFLYHGVLPLKAEHQLHSARSAST